VQGRSWAGVAGLRRGRRGVHGAPGAGCSPGRRLKQPGRIGVRRAVNRMPARPWPPLARETAAAARFRVQPRGGADPPLVLAREPPSRERDRGRESGRVAERGQDSAPSTGWSWAWAIDRLRRPSRGERSSTRSSSFRGPARGRGRGAEIRGKHAPFEIGWTVGAAVLILRGASRSSRSSCSRASRKSRRTPGRNGLQLADRGPWSPAGPSKPLPAERQVAENICINGQQ